PHRFTQVAQFLGPGAYHVARHDRGGSLPECARLHLMGEVGDGVALHLQVDRNRRAAKFGMGSRSRVRVVDPAQSWNIPGQFEDAAVVDLVQHALRKRLVARRRDCAALLHEYIGSGSPARARARGSGLIEQSRIEAMSNGNAACGRRAWVESSPWRMTNAAP